MHRFTIFIAAWLCATSLQVRGDDIRATLDTAKNEYEESLATYKDLVNDYFDNREDAAREQGNRKLVEKIKGERETFSTSGELPPTAPAPLRVRPLSAITALATAYTDAVKEYTRSNQDELAEATVKELAVIKAEAGFPSIAGLWQEGPEENGIRVTVTQRRERFTAKCKYQHKEHGEIRWRMTGTISKDGEIEGKLTHTEAPRGWVINQTRTGKFSAIDGTISGHATMQGDEHDFQWKLIIEN